MVPISCTNFAGRCETYQKLGSGMQIIFHSQDKDFYVLARFPFDVNNFTSFRLENETMSFMSVY